MQVQLKQENRDRELTGRDNQSLLVSKVNVKFVVLPSLKANGHCISFLTLEGATITLVAPDSKPVLDSGSGPEDEVEISGQNIVTIICDGFKYYVAGLAPKTRPVGRPRAKQAVAAVT